MPALSSVTCVVLAFMHIYYDVDYSTISNQHMHAFRAFQKDILAVCNLQKRPMKCRKNKIVTKYQRLKFYEKEIWQPSNFVTYFKMYLPQTLFNRSDVNQIFIIRRFWMAPTHTFSYRMITIDKTWRKLQINNLNSVYIHGVEITFVRYNKWMAQCNFMCTVQTAHRINSKEKHFEICAYDSKITVCDE